LSDDDRISFLIQPASKVHPLAGDGVKKYFKPYISQIEECYERTLPFRSSINGCRAKRDYHIPGLPTPLLEHRMRPQSPALNVFAAPGRSSSLDVALTPRRRCYIWKSGVQSGAIANATLEGFIDYLLLSSAGEKSGLFYADDAADKVVTEEDPELRNSFFVGQPAFVSPDYILGRLIRRFASASSWPGDRCDKIQYW
jgi:hypothetical protein